jgi:anti-anti-sigma regulatory factor
MPHKILLPVVFLNFRTDDLHRESVLEEVRSDIDERVVALKGPKDFIRVVINLDGICGLPSAFVGLLAQLQKAHDTKLKLVMHCPRADLRSIFDIMQMQRLLTICTSLEEALAASLQPPLATT